MYRIDLYVPETHLEVVKSAMFEAGAGRIGDYDYCCWQISGKGQFRALDGSNPYLGEKGKIEKIIEFKVELICIPELIEKVIKALIESHPYETPAYQIIEATTL
ncbi:MAG: NGG1p interacting factor NIF3 [bacterium]|nr:NGG1p interacting factor NIF3 [bacterium]